MVFQALAPYAKGFSDADARFLTFYRKGEQASLCAAKIYTRGDFWGLATRAANYLSQGKFGWGDAQVHAFACNHPLDLVWRLAATFVGAVPVTINWQADDLETLLYKIRLTGAKLIIRESQFTLDDGDGIAASLPSLTQVPADQPLREDCGGVNPFGAGSHIGADDAKIIIFTSGTTGQPKGVRHAYRAYETNAATFDQFIGLNENEKLAVVVVNPLHHANATAMTDWCMRRPGAEIHLIERYTTDFWRILVEIAEGDYDRIVVPLVSRHFDFLHEHHQNGSLPVAIKRLHQVSGRIDFLLGSAPVGPTTVKRVFQYTGGLPRVRFGSTETCLQVLGTPPGKSADLLGKAFQRGWSYAEGAQVGYYLGRPHPPHTQVNLVRGIEADGDGFMASCVEGEVGFLVTRGHNLMLGYVANSLATNTVMVDGWYTGFKDKGYWLQNPFDGYRDYYWLGRESSMLIRGGANYANASLAAELTSFVIGYYGLANDQFELAVVGLRLESEHEDSCCVMLDLKTADAQAKASFIGAGFLADAAASVSKQARPHRLLLGTIPRNFKGAIQTSLLKQAFLNQEASSEA